MEEDEDDVKNLLSACGKRNVDRVRMILDRGVDVNVEYRGETPLRRACLSSTPEVVRLLLEREADPNKAGRSGYTPLHCASVGDEDNQAIIQILLEFGAKVDSRTKSMETPLHIACTQGNNNNFKILIANGADVNALDEENRTPLYYACWYQYPNKVKYLVSLGRRVIIDAPNDEGITPLRRASINATPKSDTIMRILLLNGATPINTARCQRQLEFLTELRMGITGAPVADSIIQMIMEYL